MTTSVSNPLGGVLYFHSCTMPNSLYPPRFHPFLPRVYPFQAACLCRSITSQIMSDLSSPIHHSHTLQYVEIKCKNLGQHPRQKYVQRTSSNNAHAMCSVLALFLARKREDLLPNIQPLLLLIRQRLVGVAEGGREQFAQTGIQNLQSKH